MVSVTLDTNTVDDHRVVKAAVAAGYDVAHTTVTDRELGTSGIVPASANRARIYEPLVLDESPLGSAVLASDSEAATFERLLQIISDGSFPVAGQRDNLSPGHRRQLRDAMILCSHIRERRVIFITNDRKGFIDGGRRERIEQEFGTKVMTSEEFLRTCNPPGGSNVELRPDLNWPLFLLAFLGAGFGVGLFDQFYTARTGNLMLDLLGAAAAGGGFLIGLLFVWLIYWFAARLIFRSKRHVNPRRSLAIAAAVFGALMVAVALVK